MQKKWWQDAVVYQIYCKSFCDTNGDGIGDLRGVISKLPVLKDLGINCIWFTPIYTSPQVDNGYDVADYQDIDPDYGTLDDFKEMLDLAHSMGIRVVMDMVLNHSSDEHKWFQESRKSKDNPYRNYYIWQPPKADGSEPNNWGNYFHEGNGSAWTYDELTGEYYLHQYASKMPDLNWEYEPLRKEIYKMLHWWLDMGVDGFRLDVFTQFKKTPGFPDSPKPPKLPYDRNGFVMDRSMCTNIEGIHEIIHELNKEVFGPRDCFTVGEGSGVKATTNALDYICESREELSTVYHFEIGKCKDAINYRTVQKNWAAVMEHNAWPVQYMSNHDSRRQVSRFGNDKEYRVEAAKLLATLLHTTPGTPFVYQGEEIGMTDVRYDSIEDYNCCYTVGSYHSMVENGVDPAEALNKAAAGSRDNARTPYQWDDSLNAGFSSGKPWIKVNPNYTDVNLAKDRASENSIFAYYQKLIAMRQDHPAIIDGELKFLLDGHPEMVVYLRKCARETMLVIANYSNNVVPVQIPDEIVGKQWKRILTNHENLEPSIEGRTEWQPWEVEVYTLSR